MCLCAGFGWQKFLPFPAIELWFLCHPARRLVTIPKKLFWLVKLLVGRWRIIFYGSVKRKDLCNTIPFDLPIKLLRLMKVFLCETYIICRIDKYFSLASVHNVLKLEGALTSLLLKFFTQNSTSSSKVEVNEEKLRLNGTQRLML